MFDNKPKHASLLSACRHQEVYSTRPRWLLFLLTSAAIFGGSSSRNHQEGGARTFRKQRAVCGDCGRRSGAEAAICNSRCSLVVLPVLTGAFVWTSVGTGTAVTGIGTYSLRIKAAGALHVCVVPKRRSPALLHSCGLPQTDPGHRASVQQWSKAFFIVAVVGTSGPAQLLLTIYSTVVTIYTTFSIVQ